MLNARKFQGNNRTQVISRIFAHEVTHRMQETAAEAYTAYRDYVLEAVSHTGNGALEAEIRRYQETYEKAERKRLGNKFDPNKYEALTDEEAMDEIAADYTQVFLEDTQMFRDFAEANRTAAEKLIDFAKEIIAKIKKTFGNRKQQNAAAVQETGYDLDTIENALKLWEKAYAEGQKAVKNAPVQESTGAGKTRNMIMEIGDSGKFYVQADRQVITGDDASMWGKQIENYINETIRNQQDITIPTDDGHILILTGRSSYKLSDRHVSAVASKVRELLSDEAFALKTRAVTHIDELIRVARFDGYEPDTMNKHENDIGEDGFNYFTAYFRDFDGRYYQVPLSSAVNAEKETAYSIGKIRRRSFPAGPGSSSNKEALKGGKKASGDIIYTSSDKSQEVKTAVQLAFEKALAKSSEKERMSISGTENLLFEDEKATSINHSMTMQEAKNMIQRAFVIGGIKEWFDGEYRNGDEWLRGEGAEDVAMVVENEYSLQTAYLDKIPGLLDEEFSLIDILEAYKAGTLTGKVKVARKTIDTSSGVLVADSRFYAPKQIQNAIELYEQANLRMTDSNREAVTKARAAILLYAHNRGAASTLGITQSELNKKLRAWGGYSAKAREISQRINSNIHPANRWTGIENTSWLSRATVTVEDVERMVKSVDGDADGFQTKYIARTMLSLDTHIDWSWLTFKFDTKAGVNAKAGLVNTPSGRCNGYYSNDDLLIHVTRGYADTVAHEMGHALDYQWGRDFGYTRMALTEVPRTTERFTGEARAWYDNFRSFADSLGEVSNISSEYAKPGRNRYCQRLFAVQLSIYYHGFRNEPSLPTAYPRKYRCQVFRFQLQWQIRW